MVATLSPVPMQFVNEWRTLLAAVMRPEFELTAEEFASILSVYKQLRRSGYEFDYAVVALMTCLERQASESLDGFEDDTDSDEDATDCPFEIRGRC